jgi:glycosyltransferase involved in cell wall biosynthesis
MRIAVIAPPWLPVPPPGYGGTEIVLDGLARGLVDLGHEVLLIGHPDSTCPVKRASIVPDGDARPMGRAVTELEHAIGAYELAADHDVISDHTTAGPVVALTNPWPPVVATNHNPFGRGREAIYRKAIDRVALVAISQSHASSTDLPVAAVIHHGIDAHTFPEGGGSGGYLATLTRMSPDKGVHRAAELARSAGVPLRIAAKVRTEQEQDYFDTRVRPLLGGGIEFVGEVDATGKRELLADAVALLNPTEWAEPFGMTMLEAMACGTPVVGTPRGAAPEIVEHGVTGFLGDTDDELLDGIDRVRELDRRRCRHSVEERFSIAGMCAAYVRAYERELIRAQPTSSAASAWAAE